MTNPSGKQNTFAGHSLPSAILVEFKKKHIPVSYANAFEVPVKNTKDHGLVYNSISCLRNECISISNDFGIPVEKRLWFSRESDISFTDNETVNCVSYTELIEQIPEV